ncbi:hypothetical protein DICPUDRAFT_78936 [Dictyostelium purpureum]|uniref:Uncharacterized protein n=1 Tax=Dictyostelium purpureum TaxID=5786 RepID=F0ZL20_DICPU|nr:uncharacterized protein DICPUDRAFT_78936 [Dictyostelium purpureum]EGC35382.1 hypothetical protein DICPUDRAFT_78936 [Dictyostelium purpureum]|eukprot:XP_003288120.1 hypothetical protein DICPUDRAFT_78936 [Dictyostelium purpureum]
MKSDNIKSDLLKKAIYFIPFWFISIVFCFISYDVFFIKEYVNGKLNKTYYVSKYHDDFEKNTEMFDFNNSFTLFQMFPLVFLTLIPILAYAYMVSSILRVHFVKNALTMVGMAFTMIISLFLIVSLGLFKYSLKPSLCKDIENGFLDIYHSNINETKHICGEDFNFFKGSYEIQKGLKKTIKLEWGVEVEWFLIIAPIILSFIMLIIMVTLLIRNKYIKDSNNSLYTAIPNNGGIYEKEEKSKDLSDEMDLFWGRDDWYDYTKDSYPFALVLFAQILYILSIVLISIYKFSYYLLPFFGLLFIMLGSYYFLLFYGIRDNYLIKTMKQEGDIAQFLDKLKKKTPMVAAFSTMFINNKVVKSLEPKKITEWHDFSDAIKIDSKKPIIEIKIDEEYEIIKKVPSKNNLTTYGDNNNNNSINSVETIPPPPVQVKTKLDNYFFIKTDLPNYYIYTNNNNRVSINRTLHGLFVLLGFSFIYKFIYLNRLIEKKNYVSKTKFR